MTKHDNRIKIEVSDNGPGVEAKDFERILQPFEQVGRGPADHTEGAGLGLTLVKAFTELHGGRLAIASKPGEGFCATIELPVADSKECRGRRSRMPFELVSNLNQHSLKLVSHLRLS